MNDMATNERNNTCERRSVSFSPESLRKVESRQGGAAFSTHIQAEIDRLVFLLGHLHGQIGAKLNRSDVRNIIAILNGTPWESGVLLEIVELLPDKLRLAHRYGGDKGVDESTLSVVCAKAESLNLVERFVLLDFVSLCRRREDEIESLISSTFAD